MRDAVQVALCHDLARQQAQCPARSPFGWIAASKRHQMRLNVAGELGCLTGARFVIQSSLKTFCRKAAQQVTHRDGMEASRFRNAFVGACLSLALVGQEQHPRTGQSAGGSDADAGQVGKVGTLFVGQRKRYSFAHIRLLIIAVYRKKHD